MASVFSVTAIMCLGMNLTPVAAAADCGSLTGPEPQNMHEIARDLGAALGKPVEYRPQ